ncbi:MULTISPECIES: flagellar assembly peptidoglycan hydrolase FlgJ [Shewanella]|uniref:Peptidoglycan hydrolase FlgJ n=1 Tax=Shewanella holmiensis TaxID=2952222 RepID=A0A9X3AUW0_9GAMM|nr:MULTISPECIES: flagellar assembly peptidoglycan hydrolase FlgJ [Shewanella]MCT7941644.1 flagellar assembly peptidoglycan hydrolase FlgJ [Shewanella holmiensis]MDP5144973.1 flagellar assembly peptidoglycan hydrolase FlgJ [Shewanella sp. ULN5]
MEKLSNSSHFLDLGGLDSLRVQAQKDEKGALKEVAKQFEGIFIQMLMKSMRDANEAFKSDSPFNSDATAFYEQMRDQQMSMDLSNKGMLGLAELMVHQLSPDDSPMTPASVLRGNSDNRVNPSMFVNNPSGSEAVPTLLAANSDVNPSAIPLSDHAALSVTSASSKQMMDLILAGKAPANPIDKANGKDLPTAMVSSDVVQPIKRQREQLSKFNDPQHFISVLYPHAEKAAKQLGTTPEVLIAQSALETGWGQKVIRKPDGTMSNNLFNIKADKRWDGDKTTVNTLEFEKGIPVQQRADFRMYEDLEQSFTDFVSFISQNDRYQDARKVANEPRQFIHALQKAGYATDPQYAKKVIRVMQSVTEGLKSVIPGETK